jgi:hypothetical protein
MTYWYGNNNEIPPGPVLGTHTETPGTHGQETPLIRLKKIELVLGLYDNALSLDRVLAYDGL